VSKPDKKPKAWDTKKEIEYIDEIKDIETLEGYLKGCRNRDRWGDIDQRAVIVYASKMHKVMASDLYG